MSKETRDLAIQAGSAPQLAILIPCYNEALTVAKVTADFHRVLPEATIYVYDNNSRALRHFEWVGGKMLWSSRALNRS